jgi:hypothetical protein
VSLILEALRKLERDKDAPERGFVVMTHLPWARGGNRSRLVGIGALALAIAVAALAVALWRGRPARPDGLEAGATPTVAPLAAPPSAAPPRPSFEAKALALESRRHVPASPVGASAPVAPIAATTPRSSASSLAELRLNAISRQDDRPVAILNDRLVREGDVFDGIHVIRIGETEVEVELRGHRRVLTF